MQTRSIRGSGQPVWVNASLKCVLLIGTRSAQSIMASGFTAAQTGRTHDRTRPMLQQLRKFLPRRRQWYGPRPPAGSNFGRGLQRGRIIMQVVRIGLYLAKYVFEVHGVDGQGNVVIRKTLRRGSVSTFLPICRLVWSGWKLPTARTTG